MQGRSAGPAGPCAQDSKCETGMRQGRDGQGVMGCQGERGVCSGYRRLGVIESQGTGRPLSSEGSRVSALPALTLHASHSCGQSRASVLAVPGWLHPRPHHKLQFRAPMSLGAVLGSRLCCTGTGHRPWAPSLCGSAARKGGARTPPPATGTSAIPVKPLLPPPCASPVAEGCLVGVCRQWPQPLHSLVCSGCVCPCHHPHPGPGPGPSPTSSPAPAPMSPLIPVPSWCPWVPPHQPWPQPSAGFG